MRGLCFPSSNSTNSRDGPKGHFPPTPFGRKATWNLRCPHRLLASGVPHLAVGGLVPGRNGAVRSTSDGFHVTTPQNRPTVVGRLPDNGTPPLQEGLSRTVRCPYQLPVVSHKRWKSTTMVGRLKSEISNGSIFNKGKKSVEFSRFSALFRLVPYAIELDLVGGKRYSIGFDFQCIDRAYQPENIT